MISVKNWQRKVQAVPLTLLVIAVCTSMAVAQEKKPDEAKAQPPHAAEPEKPAPIPQEKSSITQHTLLINGQTIRYTATAGNLLIRDGENHPNGSMFYVAYTKDGAAANNRPVTFLYNGGPGSSSMWLHMGAFGPVRVETTNAATTPPAPYRVVPNAYSLLDQSDLVFVDAMGTGYSRVVDQGKLSDFLGVDQDVRAFNEFITRYLTVNQRWNSPKFLIGESYGTTRSAALAYSLQQSGISLNGVMLVSSILNFNGRAPGLDHEYISYLPSYAATAWYHDKLVQKPADLKAFLQQVRDYARGPYAAALAQGADLSPTEEDAVARRLSEMTGLSVEYLKQANLRVSQERFRKELLRTDRRTMGRYDSRFEGIDLDAAGEDPSYDASATAITGAFVAALNNYLSTELNYTATDTYRPTHYGHGWDWKHKAPDNAEEQSPDTALDLGAAMRQNPHLQLFSANGYFDLATPFFATEYDISHMQLDPTLRKNVHFGYYPSGHMIYLNVDALKQLKADLDRFYAGSTSQ